LGFQETRLVRDRRAYPGACLVGPAPPIAPGTRQRSSTSRATRRPPVHLPPSGTAAPQHLRARCGTASRLSGR
jgi:hypothetical protein